ncbi:MAG: hypothetical protein ACJ71K_01585 [Nitrososphaeraceae archaeon]
MIITLGFDGGRFGKLLALTSPAKDTSLVILCNVNNLLSCSEEPTAKLEPY